MLVAEAERHSARSCAATTGACFALREASSGTDWEAEEVVQDAYVSAFRALGTFRQEAALGTWLTRIVINEAQGRLRGRRETVPLSELDDNTMGDIIQFPGPPIDVDPERQAAIGEIRILLEGAIDALPAHFAKFSYCGRLRV